MRPPQAVSFMQVQVDVAVENSSCPAYWRTKQLVCEHTDEMLLNPCTATAHLLYSMGFPVGPHPEHIIQQASFSGSPIHRKLETMGILK